MDCAASLTLTQMLGGFTHHVSPAENESAPVCDGCSRPELARSIRPAEFHRQGICPP